MNAPSDHPRDMLRELEPAVRLGLDRHLSASREWFPHEYVPYEAGRNYVEEPWDLEDSAAITDSYSRFLQTELGGRT